MSDEHGPLWQLKTNLESKRNLLRSYQSDIEQANKRLAKTLEEIKEYESVIAKLEA